MEDLAAVPFTDISGKSSEQAIQYVACRQIMQGTDTNTFYPDGYVIRSPTTVTLLRLAEQIQMLPAEDTPSDEQTPPKSEEASDDSVTQEASDRVETVTFQDAAPDAWYTEAVSWGAGAGIITGKEDGTFAPDLRVTRAQLSVMLFRYADYIGLSPAAAGDLHTYRDGASVPAYAVQPMTWTLEQGIFDPLVSDTIYPQLPVSRAQFAQILVALTAYATQEPLATALAAQDSLEL